MKKLMNEYLSKTKDELLVKIAELETEHERLLNCELPELSGTPKKARFDGYEWDLTFPLDLELIKTHREKMLALGWKITYEYLDGGFRWIAYNHPDEPFRFDLQYSVRYEESTCVKTKIGTETITHDVYEITCKEGAEEKTFEYKEEVDA